MHTNDDDRMKSGPPIEWPPMTLREKIEAVVAGALCAAAFGLLWSMVP